MVADPIGNKIKSIVSRRYILTILINTLHNDRQPARAKNQSKKTQRKFHFHLKTVSAFTPKRAIKMS